MASTLPPRGIDHVLYKPLNYKIEKLVGSGSFSEVFKAVHIGSQEVIALKNFRNKMYSESNYRITAKEIAFLDILEHPNILEVKLYEINRVYVYIGMEFAVFGSLGLYLRDRLPLPEPIIKHVMKQLLSALSYLHGMGIFHGDIKPENILCTNMSESGPFIKIADFGLTEIMLKGRNPDFYNKGSFLYMAPEVHLRNPVDCTCDLWSAGILMYLMMFARHIFTIYDTDKQKQMYYLKRRVEPSWNGSEAFSSDCNSLVRNLLSYVKQNRLTGKNLRNHPFLNIADPVLPEELAISTSAQEDFNNANTHFYEKNYGEALVQGIKATIKLKICHNLLNDPKQRNIIEKKLGIYEAFTHEMEKALVQPIDRACPENCSDKELRNYLVSTPKLVAGYDIGCTAEMYLKEGKRDKALPMFHEALQTLLPLMKGEPKSNRKTNLGKRLMKWIENIEAITGKRSQTPPDQTAAPSTSTAPT